MANVKLSTKAVGSIVKIKVNGAAKDFIIVHQGLPSSAYDASCNGVWVVMKDIYTTMKWDGSNNDYLNSDMTGVPEWYVHQPDRCRYSQCHQTGQNSVHQLLEQQCDERF